MQHITKTTEKRKNSRGFIEILIFSVTSPGWKEMHRFREVSTELSPYKPACPSYGCKVYQHPDGTQAIFHNSSYGCPRG